MLNIFDLYTDYLQVPLCLVTATSNQLKFSYRCLRNISRRRADATYGIRETLFL